MTHPIVFLDRAPDRGGVATTLMNATVASEPLAAVATSVRTIPQSCEQF
jgi:hypothetical protein